MSKENLSVILPTVPRNANHQNLTLPFPVLRNPDSKCLYVDEACSRPLAKPLSDVSCYFPRLLSDDCNEQGSRWSKSICGVATAVQSLRAAAEWQEHPCHLSKTRSLYQGVDMTGEATRQTASINVVLVAKQLSNASMQ